MFQIFRTNKKTKESMPAGQVGDNSTPTVRKVTEKCTGERCNHITYKKDSEIITGVTESYQVDFIPKDLTQEIFKNC